MALRLLMRGHIASALAQGEVLQEGFTCTNREILLGTEPTHKHAGNCRCCLAMPNSGQAHNVPQWCVRHSQNPVFATHTGICKPSFWHRALLERRYTLLNTGETLSLGAEKMIRSTGIRLLLAIAVATLAACGGGGDSSSPDTCVIRCPSQSNQTTVDTPTVAPPADNPSPSPTTAQSTMSISLSSINVTESVSPRVTVTVKDTSGNLVSGVVVKFSTPDKKGVFDADSALTVSGKASVILSPATKTSNGADYVVATASVGGSTLTAQAGFTVTTSGETSAVVTISSLTADAPSTGISAYGQTNLTVVLAGAPAGTPVVLDATSICESRGKATLLPATLTTRTGTASFVLKDNQCGADSRTDKVTVRINGTTTSSSLDIPVSGPTASSLAFVSASPAQIYLRGSGFTESATVIFQVRDHAGNPLPNESVTLSLVSPTGGLALIGDLIRNSDSDGKVSALVTSGTVPTPVRVSARLTNTPAINTVSSGLSVAVGLPDQQRFSLAQATQNIEGYNRDGEKNTYTVIPSDRMGNPVPDETKVNFVTEAAGQIESIKTTLTATNGLSSATANFQTAGTRPLDGRITVLAYALGEESFIDTNGNNTRDGSEAFQDLGSPFVSRNFSGTYSTNDQLISPLADTNSNLACTNTNSALLPSGASIPSAANSCNGAVGKNFVRRAVETVLSTSNSTLYISRDPFTRSPDGIGNATLADDGNCEVVTIPTSNDGTTTNYFQLAPLYNLPSSSTIRLVLADANIYRLNPMPAGTTVSVDATTGISTKLIGGSPVISTTEATTIALEIGFAIATISGTVSVSTTSPSKLTTTYSIPVTTGSPSSVCSK